MKFIVKILTSLMLITSGSSVMAEPDKKDGLPRAMVEYSINGEAWKTIDKEYFPNSFGVGQSASDSFCAMDAIENGVSSSNFPPFCYLVGIKLVAGPSRIEEQKNYGQCSWVIENGKIGDSVEGKCFGTNWRVTLVNGKSKKDLNNSSN